MKKFLRLFSIALAVICFTACLGGCSITKSTDEKYFNFTLNEDGQSYTISASEETMPASIVIPKEYDKKPVCAIAENGFSGANCSAIKDVLIKSVGISIGKNAFDGLKNLRSVEIRSTSHAAIEEFAFENTPALKQFTVNKEIRVISVGSFAFKNSGLEELSLEAFTAVNVSKYAFQHCDELKSISLINLGSFDVSAISECAALESINASGLYTSKDGHLFNEDGSMLIKYAPAGAESYTVECAEVGASAFTGTVTLKSVVLSESVVNVGEYAFHNSSVESITVLGDASSFNEKWSFGVEDLIA